MNKYTLIFTAFLFFSCGSDTKEVKSITSQSDTVEKDTQTKPEEVGTDLSKLLKTWDTPHMNGMKVWIKHFLVIQKHPREEH